MLTSAEEVAVFLRKRLSAPDLVLFAGAGIGSRIKLPDWPSYLEKMAIFAESFEKPTADLMRLRGQSQYFAEAFKILCDCIPIPKPDLYKALAEPFREDKYDCTPLEPLVSLPFTAIVTTNFDTSLHQAYTSAKKAFPKAAGPADTPLKECAYWSEFYIARIHGKVEYPPSMVLASQQYTALADDDGYIDFLNHLLTHKRCLFMGFSFLDPAIGNVLNTISSKSIVSAQTHHALLPDSISATLVAKLAQVGVRVEQYCADSDHSVLWNGISLASNNPIVQVVSSNNRPDILGQTKHLVALSYSLIQLNGEVAGLSSLVMRGIVLSAVESGSSSLEEIAAGLRAVVPMDKGEAERSALVMLESLATQHLIVSSAQGERRWLINPERVVAAEPIDRLCTSVANRLLVREAFVLDEKMSKSVKELIRQIVLDRAWELAQDFMSASPSIGEEDKPMIERISLTVRKYLPTTSMDIVGSISRVVSNLFAEPEPQEESIIADLVRVAFGVQVMTNTGRSALYSLTLPQNLYMDSNILMPLTIEGHPYHESLNVAIEKLRRSSGALRVYVADVFLNEVVSHRRLAEAEYRELNLADDMSRDQYMDYYGVMGINAFIAGYMNRPTKYSHKSFSEWLNHAAPYTNEKELSAWLDTRGLITIRTIPSEPSELRDLAEVEAKLTASYLVYEDTKKIIRRKADVLKAHEARQLKVLKDDLGAGVRSYFVTDDKKLKDVVQLCSIGSINEAVMSNLSLIQLIDLTVGIKCEPNVMNRIVWSVRMLDDKMFLRDYLVARIQKQYDAAMLMTMPRMLDAVVERVTREASLEKVTIRPSRDMDKGRTSRFINRIEREFYSEMAKEIRKVKEQSNNS